MYKKIYKQRVPYCVITGCRAVFSAAVLRMCVSLQIIPPASAEDLPALPDPEGTVLKNHLKQVSSPTWIPCPPPHPPPWVVGDVVLTNRPCCIAVTMVICSCNTSCPLCCLVALATAGATVEMCCYHRNVDETEKFAINLCSIYNYIYFTVVTDRVYLPQ